MKGQVEVESEPFDVECLLRPLPGCSKVTSDVWPLEIEVAQVAAKNRLVVFEYVERAVNAIELFAVGTMGAFDESVSLGSADRDEPMLGARDAQRLLNSDPASGQIFVSASIGSSWRSV